MATRRGARPVLADIADKDPSWLHREYADWLTEQTGYETDLKTVQLARSLVNTFRNSPEFQAAKDRHAAEIAAKAVERKTASAERIRAKAKEMEAKIAELRAKADEIAPTPPKSRKPASKPKAKASVTPIASRRRSKPEPVAEPVVSEAPDTFDGEDAEDVF